MSNHPLPKEISMNIVLKVLLVLAALFGLGFLTKFIVDRLNG